MKNSARITETATIVDRIAALESIMATTDDSFFTTIDTMLNEYKARLKYLKSVKEYMVHFEGGGWNTTYGIDEESAFAAAKVAFEPGIPVRSVSIATTAGKEAAMRLFY